MSLTVDGINPQVSTQTGASLIKPEASDNMELSSLLSGSGNFKTSASDEASKYFTTNKEKDDDKKSKVGDILLDCVPSVLSTGVGYKMTGSKSMLVTCLVLNLANIAVKYFKDKKETAAA